MFDLKKWLPFKFRRGERKSSVVPVRREAPQTPELGRVFDELWRDPFAAFANLDRWFGDFSAPVFQPRVDIADEGSHLKISAELPGMDKDDVEVIVGDGVLTLRGEKKVEESSREQGVYRVERSYGFFERTLPLPDDIDADGAEARFDKGVLTVRFPKVETAGAGGRRISITG